MAQGNIFRSVCQEFCSLGVGVGSNLGGPPMNDLEPPAPGPPPAPGAVHPGRYGQQVGSTHRTGMHCSFYRPQRSWVKVIFSQACVKNSVHMGGRVSASVHAGIPPPRAGPSEHTPPRNRHPPEQTRGVYLVRGMYPLGPGGGCTSSQGVYLVRGGTWPGTPPINRFTDACKNITLPQLHCGW